MIWICIKSLNIKSELYLIEKTNKTNISIIFLFVCLFVLTSNDKVSAISIESLVSDNIRFCIKLIHTCNILSCVWWPPMAADLLSQQQLSSLWTGTWTTQSSSPTKLLMSLRTIHWPAPLLTSQLWITIYWWDDTNQKPFC